MEQNSPGRKKRARKRPVTPSGKDSRGAPHSPATSKVLDPQATSSHQSEIAKAKDSTRVIKPAKRRLQRDDQQTASTSASVPDDLVGSILKASAAAPKLYVHQSAKRTEPPAPAKNVDETAAKKPRRTLAQMLLGKLAEVFSKAKAISKPSSQAPEFSDGDEDESEHSEPRDGLKRTHHSTGTSSKATDIVRSKLYGLPPRPSLEARRRAAFETPPRGSVSEDAASLRDGQKLCSGKQPYSQAQCAVGSVSSPVPYAATQSAGLELHPSAPTLSQQTFPGSSLGVQPTFSENRFASSDPPSGNSAEGFLLSSGSPFSCEPQDEEMEDLSDVINQTISQQAPLVDYKASLFSGPPVCVFQGLYLVTDTNVFIGNLDLLRRIASTDVGGEEVIVCIPWVVVQELDNIKNRKRGPVSRDAAAAVSYIYQALASKNPRVRGQTIAEASGGNIGARTKDDLPGNILDTNDDHLLHCCLSLKEQGSRVVLVSNDVNLRNKAMINNITTWSASEVESNLRQRLSGGHGRCISPEGSNNQEAIQKWDQVPRIQQSREEACNEMCLILRGSLTLVLESELKSAFGDLWLRVVAVKPPWTEVTALECLLKHWIALSGLAFKRTLKPVVSDLVSLLKSRHELLDQLDTALGLSIDLCSELQLHYFQLAEDVSRLNAIRQSLRGQPDKPSSHEDSPATRGAAPSTPQGPQRRPLPPRAAIPPPRTLPSAAAPAVVPQRVAAAASSPQHPPPAPPSAAFPPPQLLLQEAWELVNDFCGTLCKSQKRPHEFAFVERPDLLGDISGYNDLFRHVAHAMEHMSMILKTAESRRHGMYGVGKLFVEALTNLLERLRPKASVRQIFAARNVTEKEMLDFLSDSKYKDLVFNGHKQLVILHDTIGDCILKMMTQKKSSLKPPE
ncbi:unnamed protein product [Ixodes hexagonus]